MDMKTIFSKFHNANQRGIFIVRIYRAIRAINELRLFLEKNDIHNRDLTEAINKIQWELLGE